MRADEHCTDRDRDQNRGRDQVASISTASRRLVPLRADGRGRGCRRHIVECTSAHSNPGGRLDCCTWFAYNDVGTRSRSLRWPRLVSRSRSRVRRRYRRRPRPRTCVWPRMAPHVPAGATRLGAVAVAINRRDDHASRSNRRTPTELDALLNDLYDPTSPRYEQWLTHGRVRSAVRSEPRPDRGRSPPGCTSRACTSTHVQRHGGDARPGTPHDRRRARSASRSRTTGSPQGTTGYVATGGPLVPACGRRQHHERSSASPTRVKFDTGLDREPAARSCRRRRPRRSARRGAAAAAHASAQRLHHGPQLRRRQLLDPRPGRPLLPRQRPVRRRPHRQGKDDRVARARPEPRRPTRSHYLSVLRSAQQREGQAHRRRRGRPASTERSKPRSTSRRRRPRRPARRSSRTKRRTPRPASTTRTTRSLPTTRPRWCRRVGASAKHCCSPSPTAPRSSTRCTRCSNRPPRKVRPCSRRAATPDRKTATTARPIRRARRSKSTVPATIRS